MITAISHETVQDSRSFCSMKTDQVVESALGQGVHTAAGLGDNTSSPEARGSGLARVRVRTQFRVSVAIKSLGPALQL